MREGGLETGTPCGRWAQAQRTVREHGCLPGLAGCSPAAVFHTGPVPSEDGLTPAAPARGPGLQRILGPGAGVMGSVLPECPSTGFVPLHPHGLCSPSAHKGPQSLCEIWVPLALSLALGIALKYKSSSGNTLLHREPGVGEWGGHRPDLQGLSSAVRSLGTRFPVTLLVLPLFGHTTVSLLFYTNITEHL